MGYFDKNLVGVDLGAFSDKVVSLRGGRGSYRLDGVASTPRFPSAEAVPYSSASSAAAPEIDPQLVSTMLASEGIRGRRVATAISMDHVLFRHLELPRMPEADLREAVKWELKKESTARGGDLVIDYLPLPTATSGKNEKLSLIAFAAARPEIDRLIETLRASSTDPRVIDVVPTALLAAFDMAYDWEDGANYAVLDIGAARTTLAIVKDRRLVFVRQINFGGRPITASLADGLATDAAGAEAYKAAWGLRDAGVETAKGRPIVAGHIERLCSELRRSLDYYHAQFRAGTVVSVYLSGGTALTTGLPEFVSETLGIHSYVMDPFRRVRQGSRTDPAEVAAIAPSVAVAAGLATRRG